VARLECSAPVCVARLRVCNSRYLECSALVCVARLECSAQVRDARSQRVASLECVVAKTRAHIIHHEVATRLACSLSREAGKRLACSLRAVVPRRLRIVGLAPVTRTAEICCAARASLG
jgi:hypothetical protein